MSALKLAFLLGIFCVIAVEVQGCTKNEECEELMNCIEQKCQDPCEGACGENNLCRVIHHEAMCECFPGYSKEKGSKDCKED